MLDKLYSKFLFVFYFSLMSCMTSVASATESYCITIVKNFATSVSKYQLSESEAELSTLLMMLMHDQIPTEDRIKFIKLAAELSKNYFRSDPSLQNHEVLIEYGLASLGVGILLRSQGSLEAQEAKIFFKELLNNATIWDSAIISATARVAKDFSNQRAYSILKDTLKSYRSRPQPFDPAESNGFPDSGDPDFVSSSIESKTSSTLPLEPKVFSDFSDQDFMLVLMAKKNDRDGWWFGFSTNSCSR